MNEASGRPCRRPPRFGRNDHQSRVPFNLTFGFRMTSGARVHIVHSFQRLRDEITADHYLPPGCNRLLSFSFNSLRRPSLAGRRNAADCNPKGCLRSTDADRPLTTRLTVKRDFVHSEIGASADLRMDKVELSRRQESNVCSKTAGW